jgi:sarcosine oxidase delta subunit
MRYALLLVLMLGLLATASADEGQDEQLAAARATLENYAQFVNERKLDDLRTLFTDEVDYRSESWIHVQGCKAITDALRKSISEKPELRLEIEAGAAHRVSANVVIVDGTYRFQGAANETSLKGGLTATLVREGADWKIAALRDFVDVPAPRAALFEQLAWLQGSWAGKSMDVPFRVDVNPTPGGGFLHMAMEFGEKGGDVAGLSTIIGLDASTKKVRSWHFLNDGASGDGTWTLGEQALEGKVRFVTRDGQVIDTVRRLSLQKDGQLLMETTERRSGDQVLPAGDPVRLQPVTKSEGADAPKRN